jgi:hypothetical protein
MIPPSVTFLDGLTGAGRQEPAGPVTGEGARAGILRARVTV